MGSADDIPSLEQLNVELPPRTRGDELLRPGELADIRLRLRKLSAKHDLVSVIAGAFDHRTRILPFTFSAKIMAPAGVRAIGSSMVDSGFEKTRIVLQQWNRNFRPSKMRLDGRVPDMLLVSSMRIHSAQAEAMIRDACTIDPAHRPLIIAGGPKYIYEPWDAFSVDPADPWGADIAVTGEEYVLLNLLEILLENRSAGESMRKTFYRARDAGMLDGIPGLVYAKGDLSGVAQELTDTGIQRLCADLDELPSPVLGYRLFEKPSRSAELAPLAMTDRQVGRTVHVGAMVLTYGCRFSCPYCPIPAYNQQTTRGKSGRRILEEMTQLSSLFGISFFFGTDDNLFTHRERALDILQTLASATVDGQPLKKKFRWGTEATIHDTLQMKDHLRLARKAGIRALWLGVEDMTATLINKGQSADKTREAFALLRARGISPIAMMMHHDSQPLYTRGNLYGLLNQVRELRKAGAVDMQVLMITPAPGSKLYDEAYSTGLAFKSVAGRKVEPYMMDGNYVVASDHKQPWRKQLNILVAYMYFYNPLRFLWAIVKPKSKLYLFDVGTQFYGMLGLAMTIRRTIGWALRLMFGRIVRQTESPASQIPMRSPDDSPAPHSLPEPPAPEAETAKKQTVAAAK